MSNTEQPKNKKNNERKSVKMKVVKDYIRKKRTVKIFLADFNRSYLSFRLESQKDIDDFIHNYSKINNSKVIRVFEDIRITYLWLEKEK